MNELLLDAVACVQTRKEANAFLEDLCTVGELFALQQRLAVAKMLKQNATYQEISEETGASTATISRVNRALSYGEGGYHTILDRLEGNRNE
ncbi:MAG: helix-turn-helix domain-containing protein [Lachnospiraceae bacterium]|nr:helix-turn-helix domain-containing protein [Lachnospiraceae bacterium]